MLDLFLKIILRKQRKEKKKSFKFSFIIKGVNMYWGGGFIVNKRLNE